MHNIQNLSTRLPLFALCASFCDVQQTSLQSASLPPTPQPSSDVFSADGVVALNMTLGTTCEATKEERQALILFHCDSSATSKATLRFVGESETCRYVFEVMTAAVCKTDVQFPCFAYDPQDGAGYDLEPLIKVDADYIGVDETAGGIASDITINVCRNLVNPPDARCGGRTSVCASHLGKYYSLGEAASPYVTGDGQLVFDYVNGHCMEHPERSANTTLIMLCADSASAPELQFVPVPCVYFFTWRTPYACPLYDSTTPEPGSGDEILGLEDCAVETREGTYVDLAPLAKSKSAFTFAASIEDTDYTFTLALCGALKEDCDGKSQAGACQQKKSATIGEQHSLGEFRHPLRERDGEISLTYTDGSDCGGVKRETTIRFRCSPGAGDGTPRFVAETSRCVYEIEWATAAVCVTEVIPSEPLECVAQKGSDVFDLGILSSKVEGNWLARTDVNVTEKFAFYISVCGPLAPFTGMGECNGASVCQVLQDGTTTYAAGATTSEPEVLSNGDIQIHYTLPSSFPTKCHKTFLRSATITFMCQPGTLGEPEYIGESDNCEYSFIWRTAAACAESKVVTGKNCAVTDPNTDVTYDLSPLEKAARTLRQGDKYEYTLAICGATSDCDGVCQLDLQASDHPVYKLGMANDKLKLRDGRLFLEYGDGADGRSTLIEFVCSRDAGEGSPRFVEEKGDLSYFFEWKTTLACGDVAEVECLVIDDKFQQRDLTPLKLFKGASNWEVENKGRTDSYEYLINVCHTLLPGEDARGCGASAAVCQIDTTSDTRYNMGKVVSPPQWSTTLGAIVLTYAGGDVCQVNQKPRTTEVRFYCPQETGKSAFPLGHPVFANEPDTCHYVINWESAAACPLSDALSKGCQASDPVTGDSYDLSGIGIGKVVVGSGHDTWTFQLQPCSVGETSFCKGEPQAGGCQETADGTYSLGRSRGLRITDMGVELTLSGGELCKDTFRRSAKVLFRCSTSEAAGLEFVSEMDDCSYTFVWRSPFACPSKASAGQCIVKDKAAGWTFELDELAKYNGAVAVADVPEAGRLDINVCAAALGTKCGSNVGACFTNAQGVVRRGSGVGGGLCALFPHVLEQRLFLPGNRSSCLSFSFLFFLLSHRRTPWATLMA
jgi:insulin-like growth factor 2 receptor